MSGGAGPTVEQDTATRKLAQREFAKPMVVEAGAGTGKTALLVARVVAWCVGPGWHRHAVEGRAAEEVARRVVERVVAVTFTEAAAGEMARKIGEALGALGGGEKPIGWAGALQEVPDDAEMAHRARVLADEVHRLAVGTIHSFCQRLLSTYPLEAGLHPRFVVDAEEDAIAALVVEVVEEALRTLDRNPSRPDWEVLAGAGVDPPQIAETLQHLASNGVTAADLEDDPFTPERAQREADGLHRAVRDFADIARERLGSLSGSATTSRLARDALWALAEGVAELGPSPGWAELAALAAGIPSTALTRIADWGRGDFNVTEARCLGDAAAGAAQAAAALSPFLGRLAKLRPLELTAARRVLGPLLGEVERRRAARGIVGFNDLLFRAASLVESSPSVVREVRAGIDQLLVDEFQDTDAVQCRLVEALAFGGTEPPGLFVVGDPKQSIYAWRNADLAAYARFVSAVEARGGGRHPLVCNFRSVEPILDEVREVVGAVMFAVDDVQPPFVPLAPTGELAGAAGYAVGGRTAVERWVAWPPSDDGARPEPAASGITTAFEAEAVASDILEVATRDGVRWGDIAVLLRATTAQEKLLEAFRRRGIPYEVAREREFYRQREVVEAAALVRVVVDPTDTLALLTVLRSDVVGVPDAALAPLWEAGFPSAVARLDGGGDGRLAAVANCIARAASAVPAGVPAGDALGLWTDSLTGAVGVIADLRAAFAKEPPDRFVERMRSGWLAEVSAAARFLGRFRRARLERFFADLETRLAAGEGGVAALTRFLRRSVTDARGSAVGGEPDLQANAVHVMTIHGAKGLDFKHVYLVQVHRGTGRSERSTAEARVLPLGERREYRVFGWPTPDFLEAADLKDRQSRAETARLLYVAMTRAKERLVVSGGWNGKPFADSPLEASSFADLVDHRLDREALGAQLDASVSRNLDRDGYGQWYVPSLDSGLWAGDPVGTSPDPGLQGPAEVRRQAELLAAAAVVAAARMARPLTGGASSLELGPDVRLEREESAADRGATGPHAVATAVGSAVHRLMERLDLSCDASPQLVAGMEREVSELEATFEGPALADAVSRMRTLVGRLVGGVCLKTLGSLAGVLVGREIAVVATPLEERGPVAAVSGFVDLVYRDPDDGRLVVADYKTDHLEGEEALAARTAVYEPQVRTYARALRQALALDHEPHVELWFLAADRIVRLESLER